MKSACECIGNFLSILNLVLLGFSGIALFVVGFVVAYPYAYVKHFSNVATNCTMDRVDEVGLASCSCGDIEEQCYSTYPCVRLIVNYSDIQSGDPIVDATLYGSPYSYSILVNDKCSTNVCDESQLENNKTVEKFVQRYGTVGQTFPCYPGEGSHPEALLSVIQHWHVLLGMLLPASVFFFTAIAELI